MTRLIHKAIKVYRMLDTSNRGCIEEEDLRRAIQELDATASGDANDGKQYDYLVSMMTDFKPIPRDNVVREEKGNITVNCDDIVRIAKLVNL